MERCRFSDNGVPDGEALRLHEMPGANASHLFIRGQDQTYRAAYPIRRGCADRGQRARQESFDIASSSSVYATIALRRFRGVAPIIRNSVGVANEREIRVPAQGNAAWPC